MDELYSKMGEELRTLFKDLFDPKRIQSVRLQMGKILFTAHQIGGRIEEEAARLDADIHRFLDKPRDPKLTNVMKEHALRLEQETREL